MALRPVEELVLQHCDTNDIVLWSWQDLYIREIAKSSRVWENKWITLDSILSLRTIAPFTRFIDSLGLGGCEENMIDSISGFDLKRASFSGNLELTDQTFEKFISNNCSNLEFIDISNCFNLTSSAFKALTIHCRKLRGLKMSYGWCTLNGMAELQELDLEYLCLSRCWFLSVNDLTSLLPSFKSLRYLDLTDNSRSVSYSMISALLPLLPDLRFLDVRGCDDMTGIQMEKLQSAHPKLLLKHDAKIYDDTVECIRNYLMTIIRATQ